MPDETNTPILEDYNKTDWYHGKVIKVKDLKKYEEQLDILTDNVLNINRIVPEPTNADIDKFLAGDNTWKHPAARFGEGVRSVKEGAALIASGTYAHAEGVETTASGDYAHAEGSDTTAEGRYSHAEGSFAYAKGLGAHAEGNNTMAKGSFSHTEGEDTEANGSNSHAEGMGTIASYRSEHVFGEYNTLNTSTATSATARGTYVEIVGNGTSNNARNNARTLTWEGNEWLAGNLTVNGTITASSIAGSGAGITNISSSAIAHATNSDPSVLGLVSYNELNNIFVQKTNNSDLPLAATDTYGIVKIGEGISVNNGIISNDLNIKNGDGDKSIRINKSGVATGQYSCAEGYRTQAKGSYSHAEGQGYGSSSSVTDFGALGTACHSEGCFTVAKNTGSHAEGYYSSADGVGAHAEGYNNTANGRAAHAEGYNTIANHKAQHVFGEYNSSDTNNASPDERGNYIEIVGNGYQDANGTSRSNARTLDWAGNEWLAGNLTANGSITANNFYKINESIPIGMTSLWSQNATTLGEVTFTLDLTFDYRNYNLLVVKFLLSTAAPGYKYEVVIPDSNAGKQTIIYLNACPNENALYSRNLYLYSSTVNNIKTYKLFVENGYQRSFLDNTNSSNSLVCVPMEIYGIKL